MASTVSSRLPGRPGSTPGRHAQRAADAGLTCLPEHARTLQGPAADRSVVVAAGAWSASLARELGLDVPLETQRGYHVTVQSPNLRLVHTVMASAPNLTVNPMAMGLRLAGKVEFAGLRAGPHSQRAVPPQRCRLL